MLEKLQAIVRRLDQVERQLSDPAIYADREMLTRLSREQKELLKKLEDCSGEESQPKKKSFFEKLRDV